MEPQSPVLNLIPCSLLRDAESLSSKLSKIESANNVRSHIISIVKAKAVAPSTAAAAAQDPDTDAEEHAPPEQQVQNAEGDETRDTG